MKICDQSKYLGDELKSGISDSIVATITKRKGNVMAAINGIVSLVNDPRANAIGGISLGIDVWEMAILPFLLNSADTWAGIDKKAMKMLDHIHKVFLQRLLQVKTAPIPLMYWDTGQLLMVNRIIKKKLLLIKHIASLNNNSLAKSVYMQQKNNKNLPGLVDDVREILIECDLSLDMMETFSRREWKDFVKDFIVSKNKEELLTLMKPYKKINIDELKNEDFELKTYMKSFPVKQALVKFRLRGRVLHTIKTLSGVESSQANTILFC